MTLRQLYQAPLSTGGEKELLHTQLQLSRDALLWKLEGLADAEIRRPMTRTGTNLLGIVKHLAGIESFYFCDSFGRPGVPLPWQGDPEPSGDMWAKPDEATETIVAGYRNACAAADETIRELDLDTVGKHHIGLPVSLRWMILNVLIDTTRHVGQADVLREQIDGTIGWYREFASTLSGDDEYWEKYRARMTGELDAEAWLAFNRSRRQGGSRGKT